MKSGRKRWKEVKKNRMKKFGNLYKLSRLKTFFCFIQFYCFLIFFRILYHQPTIYFRQYKIICTIKFKFFLKGKI